MARGPKLKVLALLPAVALAVVVAGCGSGSGTSAGGVPLIKSGQLTTCTHLPYQPFQVKQGDKIAHQKGWVRPKRDRSPAKTTARGAKAAKPGTRRRSPASPAQPSLFPDLPA